MAKLIIDDEKVIQVPAQSTGQGEIPGKFVYFVKRYNDQNKYPERPFHQAGPAFKQSDGTLWISCIDAIYIYTDGVGQSWMLD